MKGYLYINDNLTGEGNWLSGLPTEDISAEIVFYSGMTGFQEVLTSPEYKGKIVVFTYPIIGCSGISEKFLAVKPTVAGAVVYEASKYPSHFEKAASLNMYLKKWNIPFIDHVDTRAIVKKIRGKQSVKAIITAKQNEMQHDMEKRSVISYV